MHILTHEQLDVLKTSAEGAKIKNGRILSKIKYKDTVLYNAGEDVDYIHDVIHKNKSLLDTADALGSASSITNGREFMTVHSNTYAPLNMRIIFNGDRYGEKDYLGHHSDEPMVEFFDARHPFTDMGQFITRYTLSSLKGEDGYSSPRRDGQALDLNGGVASWRADGKTMDTVIEWVDDALERRIEDEAEIAHMCGDLDMKITL